MTTNTTAPGASLTGQEEFIDLVCSDEDWVRDEFDAIIAAEWIGPPAAEPTQTAPKPGPHPAHTPPPAGPALPPRRSQRPGTDGWVRQRSPPQQHTAPTWDKASQHETEKAGDPQ